MRNDYYELTGLSKGKIRKGWPDGRFDPACGSDQTLSGNRCLMRAAARTLRAALRAVCLAPLGSVVR